MDPSTSTAPRRGSAGQAVPFVSESESSRSLLRSSGSLIYNSSELGSMTSRRPSYTAEFSSRPRLLDQSIGMSQQEQSIGMSQQQRSNSEQRWSMPGSSNLWNSLGSSSLSGSVSVNTNAEDSPPRRDSILVPRYFGGAGTSGPGPLETFEEETLSDESYAVSEDPLVNSAKKPGQSKFIPSATSNTYSRFTSLGAIGQGSSLWGSPNSRRHSYAGEYLSRGSQSSGSGPHNQSQNRPTQPTGFNGPPLAPGTSTMSEHIRAHPKSMSVSAAPPSSSGTLSTYTHIPPAAPASSEESRGSVSPPGDALPSMRPVSGNPKLDDTINRYFSVDELKRNLSNSIILSDNPSTDMKHLGVDVTSLISVPSHRLYFVEFKSARLDVFYLPDSSSLNLKPGDLVIVDADRGKDLGKVVKDNVSVEDAGWLKLRRYQEQQAVLHAPSSSSSPTTSNGATSPTSPTIPSVSVPKQVLRFAQPSEVQQILNKQADEDKAVSICVHKVRERELDMTVVDAEYQWDRRKLTFFYSASHRIDFRDLVRELFRVYKTRIWMCAVGADTDPTAAAVSSASGTALSPKQETSKPTSSDQQSSSQQQQQQHQQQQQQPMPMPIPSAFPAGVNFNYGQGPPPFMQQQQYVHGSPTQNQMLFGQSHWKQRGMAPNVPPLAGGGYSPHDLQNMAFGGGHYPPPTGGVTQPQGFPQAGFPQLGQYWYTPSTY